MTESARHAVVIVLLAVSVMPAIAAEPTTPRSIRNAIDESALEWSELAPSERTRAEHWNLSATQWRRYRSLMDGIRGSISPATLSPIEVLGIHARDDAERQRYAEQWAVMMREDAQRVLAFQRAYDAAARELFAGEPLIALSRLADRSPDRSHDEAMLRTTDRVLLFARLECTRCDTVIARLVERIDRLAGIDVYLSGISAGDEQAVRDWAVARGIHPDWVRTRKVTLNFEAGALDELSPGSSELPVLMRRRGESVTQLSESAL